MSTRDRTGHDRAEIRASFLRAVLALDRSDGEWASLSARAAKTEPSPEPADKGRQAPRPTKKKKKKDPESAA
jgi:hypothetical protein